MGQMSSSMPAPTTGGKTAQPSMGQPNQYAQGGDMIPSPQPVPSMSSSQNSQQGNFNNMMKPSPWDNSHVGNSDPFGKGGGGKAAGGAASSGGKGGSPYDEPLVPQSASINPQVAPQVPAAYVNTGGDHGGGGRG